LREERTEGIENRVLRRMCGEKIEEVRGVRREHIMRSFIVRNFSPDTVRMIKS
jgi:hypothetical protein